MKLFEKKLARFSTQPSVISWISVTDYIRASSITYVFYSETIIDSTIVSTDSVLDGSANEELKESFRQEVNLVFLATATELQNEEFKQAFVFVLNFISENIMLCKICFPG